MARTVSVDPPRLGRTAGLAWARFDPDGPPKGAVLILHGAGSSKEAHFDFGRQARAAGLAALCFDIRGHGESDGRLGRGVLDDLAVMAGELPGDVPLALRGSSLGGYLAIAGAARVGARAVVAICPAPADQLIRGLRAGHLDLRADDPALIAFLSEHDDLQVVSSYEGGLLLMHAEGDEIVPYTHSAALHAAAVEADPKRLLVLPGGHHRSVTHDPEMQAVMLRWLRQALG
ncbi:MAG TPA: alpha/beta fold hydrolase [Capillimicrobium sp.]|jgi:alpha-beta hydrolase superfamily lysophospholipase